MAKVGDRTLSVAEFIRRAEYTIRPAYCRKDNYIHRKIVLNSLIAEKLLALEAGKENPLVQNEEFQDFLEGRKEQAMRQWLFAHDFYRKVTLDTTRVKQVYRLAGRTYQIAYFSVKTPSAAKIVREKLNQGEPFEQVFRDFGGLRKLPRRQVAWAEPENEAIEQALFSAPVEKNAVIGPLQVGNNYYTTIKILGWTDEIALSTSQMQQRWKDVSDRLREQEAEKSYLNFVARLMHGKRVEFNPETFRALVKIYQPLYLKSDKEKKRAFNERFWQKKSPEKVQNDRAGREIAPLLNRPLLRLNHETWTVARFLKEERIHPLVFRKKKMTGKEFPEQFKLAIVDLIQDKFVAEAAQKKGYDTVDLVQRNVAMWRDNLLALYQRNRFLESIGKKDAFYKDQMKVLKEDLNPYIRKLQQKYANQIEIDTDAFEKIHLTRIDMMVLQKNVPFPIVVPSFPVVTTLNKLDYGRKMSQKNK
ncbi:MAG: hypothetical protein GXO76_06020 [Calditrichaeota bacterium]|nr:hypothetical protein [Calditrichota bacterium]